MRVLPLDFCNKIHLLRSFDEDIQSLKSFPTVRLKLDRLLTLVFPAKDLVTLLLTIESFYSGLKFTEIFAD